MNHVEIKAGGAMVTNGVQGPIGVADPRRSNGPALGPEARVDTKAEKRTRQRVLNAMFLGPLATIAWLYVFTLGLTINSEPFRRRLENMGGPTVAAAPVTQPAAAATQPAAQPALESPATKEPATLPPPVASASVTAPLGLFSALWLALFVTVTFTPTNVAVLCCLAALVGCFGRIATATGGAPALVTSAQSSMTVGVASAKGDDAASAAPGSEMTVTVGSGASADGGGQPAVSDPGDMASGTLAPAVAAVMWGFFIYLSAISGLVAITGDPFSSTTPGQYLRLAGAVSLFAFVVGWRPHLLMQLVSQVGPSKFGKVG